MNIKQHLNTTEEIIKQFDNVFVSNKKLIIEVAETYYYIYYKEISIIEVQTNKIQETFVKILLNSNRKFKLAIQTPNKDYNFTVTELATAISEQIERL